MVPILPGFGMGGALRKQTPGAGVIADARAKAKRRAANKRARRARKANR